ncbi:AraC family transcriptional regulator [Flavobacterium zepuense]|uniref:AraC family transcriptional regulator n=1 Tax=Flavobacterium zepuense TaxID=2593302 RepID=A0A552V9M0_9FLAO|nr:helix-turn-helix transcriptional regulator [Flavobacterium zepuense]TRW27166.1 AraC family transcriptional regulator [Flavobacterium zepuense]
MNEKLSRDHVVWLPHPNKLLVIEPIDYPNPYDYHRPHRHDYFEIILIQKGEGKQYVDFTPYEMHGRQLFNVYPGQVHLMHRNTAQGLLIQFRKDLFEFIRPLQHYQLYFIDPVFNPEPQIFDRLFSMTEQMADLLAQKDFSQLSIYKAYCYLEIILISLVEMQGENIGLRYDHLTSQFLSVLSQNIYSHRKAADYCKMLNCSRNKLNQVCKAAFGKSALELIHEELLLEIRRLLLLGKMSLKEIAFALNFDSPANFSIFIKSKTGLTPSELQSLVNSSC